MPQRRASQVSDTCFNYACEQLWLTHIHINSQPHIHTSMCTAVSYLLFKWLWEIPNCSSIVRDLVLLQTAAGRKTTVISVATSWCNSKCDRQQLWHNGVSVPTVTLTVKWVCAGNPSISRVVEKKRTDAFNNNTYIVPTGR